MDVRDAGFRHVGRCERLERLAALPYLREISLGGSPRVTRKGLAAFPASIRVKFEP